MQKEEESLNRLTSRRKNAALPLVSNLVLIVTTAIILWWSVGYFQQNIAIQAAQESRFLTMEWDLLQELKAQTDQQLMEKDREIAALRNQYLRLVARGGTDEDLSVLAGQLATAEAEREIIVRQRIDIAQPPMIDQVIRRMDGQQNALTGKLQAELDELRRETFKLNLNFRERVKEITDTLAALDGQLKTSSVRSPRAAPPDLEQTTMEMINTRALLRAFLSSPDIRRDYPTLINDFDLYTATLESRAQKTAQEATLAEASAEIESLAKSLGITLPLSTYNPPETREGYLQRLGALLRAAIRVGG